jgi:hypothetical protein
MELQNYNFGRLLVVRKTSTLGIADIKRLTGSSAVTALRNKKAGEEDPVATLYAYLPRAFEWSRNGIPLHAGDMDKTTIPPFNIYKLDAGAESVRYAKARRGAFMAALQFDDRTFRKFFKTMDLISAILMVRRWGCPGDPVLQRGIVRGVSRLNISRKNLDLYNGQLHALANGYAQETLDDALVRIKGYMANKW